MKTTLNYRNKEYDITIFLVTHEVVEKALLDLFGITPKKADEIATLFEIEAVRTEGLSWNVYTNFVRRQNRLRYKYQLPLDLDLKKYTHGQRKLIKDQRQNMLINKEDNSKDYVTYIPYLSQERTSFIENTSYIYVAQGET